MWQGEFQIQLKAFHKRFIVKDNFEMRLLGLTCLFLSPPTSSPLINFFGSTCRSDLESNSFSPPPQLSLYLAWALLLNSLLVVFFLVYLFVFASTVTPTPVHRLSSTQQLAWSENINQIGTTISPRMALIIIDWNPDSLPICPRSWLLSSLVSNKCP